MKPICVVLQNLEAIRNRNVNADLSFEVTPVHDSRRECLGLAGSEGALGATLPAIENCCGILDELRILTNESADLARFVPKGNLVNGMKPRKIGIQSPEGALMTCAYPEQVLAYDSSVSSDPGAQAHPPKS